MPKTSFPHGENHGFNEGTAHDTTTGEIIEPQTIPGTGTTAQAAGLPPPIPAAPAADFPDMPDVLKRRAA